MNNAFIRTVAIITPFVLTSSAALAVNTVKPGPVPLNFDRVIPGLGINVSLSQLDKNKKYRIECVISHPNNSNKAAKIDVLATLGDKNYPIGDISFNGVVMNQGLLEADLPGDKTILTVDPIWPISEGLSILNKTYSDPTTRSFSNEIADIITVTNCVATESTK